MSEMRWPARLGSGQEPSLWLTDSSLLAVSPNGRERLPRGLFLFFLRAPIPSWGLLAHDLI